MPLELRRRAAQLLFPRCRDLLPLLSVQQRPTPLASTSDHFPEPHATHLARALSSNSQSHDTTVSSTSAPPQDIAPLCFRDYRTIFLHASTWELLRAWAVFRLCGIPTFVRNGEALLATSNRLLGRSATSFLVKHTFFNHFCAGETTKEVHNTIRKLQARGVSSILDYAAEDDVQTSESGAHAAPLTPDAPQRQVAAVISKSYDRMGHPVARVYSYSTELQCDRHVDTFLKAIDTAGSLPGQGFAAIKVTALGNPELLERVSNCINTVRGLFQRFDADGSGYIDRLEFITAHQQVFPEASAEDSTRTFAHYDRQSEGKVDYVAWCQGLSLRQMPLIAASIHRAYGGREEVTHGWLGDLSASCLTEEEYELVVAMKDRLQRIVERAAEKNVKLMVDAEHTYFQPAIDHLSLQLMKQYNVNGKVIIYNTYQAYLRNCHKRLRDDLERSRREGYTFALKLVRGAYLQLERARAEAKGYTSPVWDSLEDTHASYSACLELALNKVATGAAEVLLGTHNEESVQKAVQLMKLRGLPPGRHGVYFGQLLGMADHLTFTLGGHGYPAYKYVPYGLVHEVMPYLLRRSQENASILSGTKEDLRLLQAELARRLGIGREPPKFNKRS